MHLGDEIGVDVVRVLPEVSRFRQVKGVGGIDQSTDEKDPCGHVREKRSRNESNPVIETVDRTPGGQPVQEFDGGDDSRGSFDLHVEVAAAMNEFEDLGQSRRVRATLQIGRFHPVDSSAVRKNRVVMNDGDVVACDVNVELDSVNAEIERSLKRGDRVFGRLAVGATMGDDFNASFR